ncbi:type II toxin-antitoxin system VapB family antitoxin [Kerstersia gyiorum]|jgi:antitoxin VapB|uniref:antitoxin n=1 Tax=Kerstersia gyiorum TaxID=206506 RepID=UPI0021504835|nr:type II toxin-antitoxin system VapB family antitoxin [Kerstersia gyiorum]MCR4158434.1 type II toxin-antitoxin system VapB family antitoxin [Kerstersia gyiorum]
MSTAKIFMNGRSQAVRLPAEFRFDTDEVYIHRDPDTGDVILSARPKNWNGFFAAQQEARDETQDFLVSRDSAKDERDPFEGWTE